ncbi:MAG: glycosyl hydrolase [Acidobacteriota bacterium]
MLASTRRRSSRASLVLGLAAYFSGAMPALASEPAKNVSPAPTAAEAPKDPLAGLKVRLLGPAWGGRTTRAVGVPGNPLVYYAASASGGVWKSSDGGQSFASIFDDQPVSSIGSIAVAPSDPNVIYVGSGEANIRGNVAAGNGIYKSTDAGKTWTHVWSQIGQIGTIAIDPRDADIAFAAVLGHAYGPNPERGVYRTRDGGKTWQQVLKKDADTGASDVAIDPRNPRVIFAGLWQVRRRPWELVSGGPGSGLYVSRDGGDTWKQLTGGGGNGLPEGLWGKVGIAIAPSDDRRVYALIENLDGGLFRSDDGGEKWTHVSSDHRLRQRHWYYTTMTVNPTNPDEAWFPQVALLKTIDGGKNFTFPAGYQHGDMHDAWIDPQNPKRMIVANDGGVDLSLDGGETWWSPPLPIGQFYHVGVDSSVPFKVAGSLQDIGTAQGPSNSLLGAGIRNADWYGVGGGEAGWVVADPADNHIVFAGDYGGYLSRHDSRTGETRHVGVYPYNASGHGGEDLLYRFQWTAPIATSPHDPKVVYHGANVLFRSDDEGFTWKSISPDLTRDDKSKEKRSGGPITGDNTGVEIYCTIFAIAESPREKGVIWVGSDDGLVHVTRDGGAGWNDVSKNLPGLAEWSTIAMIEPSHFDAGTAYVVADAHRLDDPRPYLWKTADYGATWTRLDAKLDQASYLRTVREDPTDRNVLWLGTENGITYSLDAGASWKKLGNGMPTVAVTDLVIKDRSLVASTLGRSMWILDDRTPLLVLTAARQKTAVDLLPVQDAVRWSYGDGYGPAWTASNPPRGAVLHYWLKGAPKGEVTIDILDRQGRTVDTLSSKAKEPSRSSEYVELETEALKKAALSKDAGLNVATWDLHWAGAEMITGAIVDSGDPAHGPLAAPGAYFARLTVDSTALSVPFHVLADPRSTVPPADLDAQLALGLAIRDAITDTTRAVNRLQSLRRQLSERTALLKAEPALATKAAALVKSSDDLIARLDAIEKRLHNPDAKIAYDVLAQLGGAQLYSRLSPLMGWATSGSGAPTQGVKEEFARQRKELDGVLADFAALIGDLARQNADAVGLGVPAILIPGAK